MELEMARTSGNRAEATRHDGEVGFRLVLEQAQLRGAIRVKRPVTVEVVGLEVEKDADARPEAVHVLQLEARKLADDPGVLFDCAVERSDWTANVAGDGHGPVCCAEDRTQQLARRRLPVRAGDAEEGV